MSRTVRNWVAGGAILLVFATAIPAGATAPSMSIILNTPTVFGGTGNNKTVTGTGSFTMVNASPAGSPVTNCAKTGAGVTLNTLQTGSGGGSTTTKFAANTGGSYSITSNAALKGGKPHDVWTVGHGVIQGQYAGSYACTDVTSTTYHNITPP